MDYYKSAHVLYGNYVIILSVLGNLILSQGPQGIVSLYLKGNTHKMLTFLKNYLWSFIKSLEMLLLWAFVTDLHIK